jgi:hypothetical protein
MSFNVSSFSFVPGDFERNAKPCFQKQVWAAELFAAAKQLIKLDNIIVEKKTN